MVRLTWWEYSWDVMEPISYILSACTGIMAYWFFVITKREYTYETLHEITLTSAQQALYKKKGFDIQKYSDLDLRMKMIRDRIRNLEKQYGKD
ncbi:hypothetical protein HDV05_001192 [Chytridiales sp. JEL 0842]|nr:hypothetical protein HDV05_001192 [Chytridiales sp. JEL 0842]